MLDQPVPNPLASNPNVHTHKVFAAIGLILIGTLIVTAGIWYYSVGRITQLNLDQATRQNDNYIQILTSKESMQPRRIATTSSKVLDTTSWKEHQNKYFSFKFPSDFKINNDYGLGVRVDSGDLKKYYPQKNGEQEKIIAGSQLELSSSDPVEGFPNSIEALDQKLPSIIPAEYLMIDGVKARKVVTYNSANYENQIGAIFFKNNRRYLIVQKISVTANDIDGSVFDALVKTFKFL